MEKLVEEISKSVDLCDNGPWMIPEMVLKSSLNVSGVVLVIGVGGSTLRLTRVTVASHSTLEELLNQPIPDSAKKGDLFAWCVSYLLPELDISAAENQDPNYSPVIALSWSFPLVNNKILVMGKSFDSKYVGHDVVDLFNNALPDRYRVLSVTHDGTSSLIAGIHESHKCRMSLTLGTGVNINVRTSEDVLVNTEISMLGRDDTTEHIELYEEDWDVKGHVLGIQPFEAKVGGMYIGQMMSNALGQETSTLEVWKILENEREPRYELAHKIVKRAASLVASAIYGLNLGMAPHVVKSGGPIEVVYTGGVMFEPEFRKRLEMQLSKLAKMFGFTIELVPQRYGSEIGAAIAALAAHDGTV